jgi:prepilin-type N-terminal cleavage/methylation domain-containing protein/prepilin-type processing-associated H-X9-DG protein
MHDQRPRGFTLVELLVAIGIIVILIAILIPAISGARRSANVAKCQANLRGVGQAMTQYATRNRGHFPYVYITPQTMADGTTDGVFWWQRLMLTKDLPGLEDPSKSVTVCPADDDPYRAFTMSNKPDLAVCSYGMNRFLSIQEGISPPLSPPDGKDDETGMIYPSLASIKNPGNKILAGDVIDSEYLASKYPNTHDASNAPFRYEFAWTRHGTGKSGSINILWADGHVTAVKQGIDLVGQDNEINGFLDRVAPGDAVWAKAASQWRPDY